MNFDYYIPSGVGIPSAKIKNASGVVVWNEGGYLDYATSIYGIWSRRDNSGNLLPFGQYTLEVRFESYWRSTGGVPRDVVPKTCSFNMISIGNTISSNVTLGGTINFNENITISNNAVLTIAPGSTIKFGSGINMYVMAGSKIIAEGTQTRPILFTSAAGTLRGSWGNVYVYSSNNSFKWCCFQYGNWALKVHGYPNAAVGNVIENCTFRYNDQGLRIHTNTATVSKCQIYDNRHGLVCFDNTDVTFTGNTISANDRDGMYSGGHNVLKYYWNLIENNGFGHSLSCNGLYAINSDNLWLGYGSNAGYNTIRYNYDCEIKADQGITTVKGVGSNAIYDATGYELYNYSSNPAIQIQSSWWGENPPNSSQFYGPKDIAYYLTSYPYIWAGSTGMLGKALAGPTGEDIKEKIRRFKEIIKTKPSDPEAEQALKELYGYIRSDYVENQYGEKNQFDTFLDETHNNHKDKKIGKIALVLMVGWKMAEDDDATAIQLSQEALQVLSGEERMSVLENLVLLYLNQDQVENAKFYLEECKKKYSQDKAGIQFIEEELADVEYQIAAGYRSMKLHKGIPKSSSGTENIIQFELLQNYPNPGNPSTMIQFKLPHASRVVLKVVNLLGQEVKTLVNEQKDTGSYSVIWDGKDNRDCSAPSGIYLYILRTDEKVITKKLTLLK